MISNVRIALVVWALVMLTAAAPNAADIRATPAGGLTVHEWGTFTSVAGEDGSAIDWDVLGGKDDLPGFVLRRNRCSKFALTGTVRMETPVLYFYSPSAVDAHVRVAFPKGLITEWYPQAENQNGIDTSMSSLTGSIEWKSVKVDPNSAPYLPVEGSPSRYYAARTTDAAPVTVGDQHEKFLFYRGVGRFAVPLSASIAADGRVAVENLGADAVPMVMLFENRGGRLGYRTVSPVSGPITLDPPSLDGSFAHLQVELENALVAQGLFRKEAQAMVDTWRDSWFEEGSRLIYIVPPHAVDAILPLQVEPAPSLTTRVFVGRIELITSATKRAVETAMATNDRAAIERYGRFLDPILRRMASENPAGATVIERFRANVQDAFAAAACR